MIVAGSIIPFLRIFSATFYAQGQDASNEISGEFDSSDSSGSGTDSSGSGSYDGSTGDGSDSSGSGTDSSGSGSYDGSTGDGSDSSGSGTDNSGNASSHSSTKAYNSPPSSDAGSSQRVTSGETVYLDGTGSNDPEKNSLTYDWTQRENIGPSVSLLGSSSSKPTFDAPPVESVTRLEFKLVVNDGEFDSNPSYVSITVMPPEISTAIHPPIALDGTASTPSGTPVTIKLIATDEDQDGLTISIVGGTSHGSLGGIDQTSREVIYTSDEGYNGPDSFTFKVNDGEDDSNIAKITITVKPPEISTAIHPPIALDGTASTPSGTPVTIKLIATDEDPNDVLEKFIEDDPQGGSLGDIDQATSTVKYTPNQGFTGSDSFTFFVDDGRNASNIASVNITVIQQILHIRGDDINYHQKAGENASEKHYKANVGVDLLVPGPSPPLSPDCQPINATRIDNDHQYEISLRDLYHLKYKQKDKGVPKTIEYTIRYECPGG